MNRSVSLVFVVLVFGLSEMLVSSVCCSGCRCFCLFFFYFWGGMCEFFELVKGHIKIYHDVINDFEGGLIVLVCMTTVH